MGKKAIWVVGGRGGSAGNSSFIGSMGLSGTSWNLLALPGRSSLLRGRGVLANTGVFRKLSRWGKGIVRSSGWFSKGGGC